MTARHPGSRIIWATRGRSWGFRFLLTGGLADPLAEYENTMAELGDAGSGWCLLGDRVGVRFPDPEGRRDTSGRVIPHDFVLAGPLAQTVRSVDQGIQGVWPFVAEFYRLTWAVASPPSEPELDKLRRQLE